MEQSMDRDKMAIVCKLRMIKRQKSNKRNNRRKELPEKIVMMIVLVSIHHL